MGHFTLLEKGHILFDKTFIRKNKNIIIKHLSL